MSTYNHLQIENKWQKIWEETNLYKAVPAVAPNDSAERRRDYSRPSLPSEALQERRREKYYVLDMFPYPSGVGLHVGHPKGYIATDVIARYQMMHGKSVLHPMGFDAFGLPAENYAIKNKIHPAVAVRENIRVYENQLRKIGFTYDWDREINTTDPEYYRWTQWIFLQLFKKGLAYQSDEPINWCPSCKTGLANEDLEDGKCERCGSIIEKKKLPQWVLKMTTYADRLLYDLDSPELEWTESTKELQRNWIGRSEGAEVVFKIIESEHQVTVFTTRPDTLFGATYLVLAPEHPLVEAITTEEQKSAVVEYQKEVTLKNEITRTDLTREKTGVFTGAYAENPVNGQQIPVWIADYVLPSYGTGAIMAVPAHDERDFEFATKFKLPITDVIKPATGERSSDSAYTEVDQGIMINSEFLNGLTPNEAISKMTDWLTEKNIGKKQITYKIRDWVFSRQRYWGEPIPIIHCPKCGAVPVDEKDLPLTLPEVEHYEPSGTGESPLATIESWVNTTCPKCGGEAKRETNTMPQWGGSSWYYLRYIDPKNTEVLVDKELEKKWMPVDLYVGGAEHITRHLIYARFWHKFLYDIGVVSTLEPFKRLVSVGLINAEDGRKMSKRWNNVVNPDDIIEEYGADALRVYEMFMGPFTQAISWSTDGLKGTRRFLEKIWRLADKVSTEEEDAKFARKLHQTIAKVTSDIPEFKFNTAIAALMELVNETGDSESINKNSFKIILQLLSPFAPHLTEELWHTQGEKKSIFLSMWPQADASLIISDEMTIVVQTNGKVRDELTVATSTTQEEIETLAKESTKVQNNIAGKKIIKVIYVPKRLINIVTD